MDTDFLTNTANETVTFSKETFRYALNLFAKLATKGNVSKELFYIDHAEVRKILNLMAQSQQCDIVETNDSIYLVPTKPNSPFQMSHAELKARYFTGVNRHAANLDIYMSNLMMLVLFAIFTDYGAMQASDYVEEATWLKQVQNLFQHLSEHLEKIDSLDTQEKKPKIAWKELLQCWQAMDVTGSKDNKGSFTQKSILKITEHILCDSQCIRIPKGTSEIYLTEFGARLLQLYQNKIGNAIPFDTISYLGNFSSL